MTLYSNLLGTALAELAPPVRRLHEGPAGVRGRGVFVVRRGGTWLARALGALLRLPRAGRGVAVELRIEHHALGERWLRTFGDCLLITEQHAGAGSTLVERFGMVAISFRLRVDRRGGLCFEHVATRVCGIRVPRWMGPRVRGRARPQGAVTRIGVVLSFLGAGRVIAYRGAIEAQ